MTSRAKPPLILDKSWEIAIRKAILVFGCMTGAYFLVALATIFYYFLFSLLTASPQEYPGIESWQPFWNIGIFFGFLVGIFKSFIDILAEKMLYQRTSLIERENEDT